EVVDGHPLRYILLLRASLDFRGTGINATLGVIARPVKFVQVGVAFAAPTYYQMCETYNAEMNTSWKNFDYYGDGSVVLNDEWAGTDVVASDYTLTTPLKFSTGVAFISKRGYIAADVEFVNPAKAKYDSDISGISYA